MHDETAYKALMGRLADMREFSQAEEPSPEEYALAISPRYIIEVQVAVGGPTESIEFEFYAPNETPSRATYHHSWAVPDHCELTDDETAEAWEFLGYGLTYMEVVDS